MTCQTPDGEILGIPGAIPNDGEVYLHNQRMGLVLPKQGTEIDTGFLFYLFCTKAFNKHLVERATGTKVKHTSPSTIESFVFPRPPLPEQRKIANILSTWDEALEKLDALIAAKERRKKALMQQLLTGQRRLPGCRTKWAHVHLKDVANESMRRNRTKLDRARLYAVTKAEGMVPMREQVQGATIDRCKIVEQGWFAYNPMRINIGSIARWMEAAPVMVSPDYVVFHTDERRLLSDYLNHVRRTALWSSFVGGAGNGSVRVRIWFDDLGHLKLHLPPVSEQRAIADVLDTVDVELRFLRNQRTALDQQKRGLMQQLLTGKVRVPA